MYPPLLTVIKGLHGKHEYLRGQWAERFEPGSLAAACKDGGCRGWTTTTWSRVHFQTHPKELRCHLPLSYSCRFPVTHVSQVCGIHPVTLSPTRAWVWVSWDHSSISSERGCFKEQGVLLCLYQSAALTPQLHALYQAK